MNARESAHARSAPSVAASRVFTRPASGYFAMTIRRALLRGAERLDIAHDLVDLGVAEDALERRHHRAGTPLLDGELQRRPRAPAPERRVAEVARLRLERGGRRPVAGARGAVARRAADLVHRLPVVGRGRAAPAERERQRRTRRGWATAPPPA